MTTTTTMIVACAYCEREMSTSQIHKHESVCVFNPDIASAVRACMHGCAEGPFLPSYVTYDAERRHIEGLPSSGTILTAMGISSWDDLAPWAGLRPLSERLAYTLEELRRVSAQNHDGEIGPSAREWDTEIVPGAMTAKRLIEIHGAWSRVLAAAGLRYESRGYYLKRTKDRVRLGEIDSEEYIEEARRKVKTVEDDYPLLPGKWKRKTYALWPSGQPVTSLVYELR